MAASGEGVAVSAIDPVVQFSIVGQPGLAPMAEEVRARLLRVLERV